MNVSKTISSMQFWAVIASTGNASMICAVFDTEQEAIVDLDIRTQRYPKWTFHISLVRKT